MSVVSTVRVIVPGTTANLGPGFDCIGAALTVYNQFKVTRLESVNFGSVKLKIDVTGVEANKVSRDESNLVYRAFATLYDRLGKTPPPVHLEIDLGVPLARGLGSSATAIVGGLIAANQLAGKPLSQQEVMELAIAIEGHPDNVVPALLGGCRLTGRGLVMKPQRPQRPQAKEQDWVVCDVAWSSDLVPVVAIPDFELSTQEARQVLPDSYSRGDAVLNVASLGLLLRGLESGKGDWLRVGLQDRIHQPYRQKLIPGYDAVEAAALDAGAYGMVISGAGPTLLALVSESQAPAVQEAMAVAWTDAGIQAQVRSLSLDSHGTKIALELIS